MIGSARNGQWNDAQARALVDPEIEPMIDALPLIDLSDQTLAEARQRGRLDPRLFDERLAPKRVRIGGALEALLFDPPRGEAKRGAVLHLHGGGMVMGSADMSRRFVPTIALDHALVVLSVEYRLAPEHPFPAQIEDGEAALAWLLANTDMLGLDAACIFLMGESAGGGLAAGLALKLRDRGGPPLAGLILTYPMIDHRTGGADDPYRHGPAGRFVWTGERNAFGWRALAGGRKIRQKQIGWFSPALANDLGGLPPTFLATGALDLFLTENLEFTRRLCVAGVPCEAHVYPGAIHGFDLMRRSQLAVRYRREMREWIAAQLGSIAEGSAQ